jgi:DNA-3-methyladenine glycosylase II
MATIELAPKGPFDLRLLAGFGFGPTTGTSEPTEPVMRLAFCLDDLQGHAGAVLRQDDDGIVRGQLHGDGEPAAVEAQLSRILSLDHDGQAWLEVGRRDPVIGQLQRRFPGLRPPLFHSPYEAAAWRSSRPAARHARQPVSGPRSRSVSDARSTLPENTSPLSRPREGCSRSSR